MNHENYTYEVEAWLKAESDLTKKPFRSKPFIGDRPYRHFDGRVALSDMESNKAEFLLNELRHPTRLAKHAFFPFVRKDRKVRRFTKLITVNEEHTKEKSVVIKQKLRPIMYASHRDAAIYGFYGQMLKKAYDQKTKLNAIDESVIAYRKIPRNDGSGRNKSNIDFANDIYKLLGQYDESAIMCLDITDFFGSMVHTKIETSWSKVLGVGSLPIGHKTVFKNITRYRYLFLDEARVALGLGHIIHGKFVYKEKLHSSYRTGPLSKTSEIYNEKIKKSSLIKVNGSPKGIPQGSPISDIIANMYLLDFDIKTNDLLSSYDFGLLRRYSDDILIICPVGQAVETYDKVAKMLANEGLKINKGKTELFYLDRKRSKLTDMTSLLVSGYAKNKSSIQYLGFEFDLKDIHVRSGTIANHYRKLKRSIRKELSKDEKLSETTRANKKRPNKKDKYAYIKQASKRIEGARLSRQFDTVRRRTAKLRRDKKTDK